MLARDIGNPLALQIMRIEQVARLRCIDIDEEQHRRILGGLADAAVHDIGGESLVVGAQVRPDLLEFGLVEQIEAMDQVILKQLETNYEQTGQREGGAQGIPEREPGADGSHNNW